MLFLLLAMYVAGKVFLCYEDAKYRRSYAATDAECAASEAFTDWRLRNPGVYIGLSLEGRALVRRCLETYEVFLQTHPYIDGTQHKEWLLSLFNELPPKHPRRRKLPKSGISVDACLFLQKIRLFVILIFESQ